MTIWLEVGGGGGGVKLKVNWKIFNMGFNVFKPK